MAHVCYNHLESTPLRAYLSCYWILCHSIMPQRSSNAKRPTDANQRAKLVVDIATGQIEDKPPDTGKNPAAVALGRLGGQKGGKARAEKLSAKRRSQIAKKAAKVRWGN
jgi:hypothetical protein